MTRLSWSVFKSFIDARQVPAHETEESGQYLMLEAFDGPVTRGCKLDKASADYTDYINNYQSISNKTFTDSNGSVLSRNKITQSGWHYQLYGFEAETAKIDCLVDLDVYGDSGGCVSVKYFDSLDNELVAGTQVELDSNCVRTDLYFEPPWDYEIIGGQFRQLAIPGVDIRLSVIGVPDLTVGQGGSVPFANNLNLRYIGTADKIHTDGRTSKKLVYDATNHTNKLAFRIDHPLATYHKVQFMLELFRA